MDLQNVSSLVIPEGNVRTIHDKNSRLLWGKLSYDTKYVGNAMQDGTPTPDTSIPVQVVTDEQTILIGGKNLINNANLDYDYTNGVPSSTTLTTTLTGIRYDYTGAGNPVVGFKLLDLAGYEGKTFRMSSTFTGQGIRMQTCNADVSVRILVAQTETSGETISWTVPNDISSLGDNHYLAFQLRGIARSVADFSNLIMTVDNADMSYEPYYAHSYYVSLGSTELCKIGDYQDYIYKSGDDWHVHKDIDKYTFTGSENWGSVTYGTNSWVLNNVVAFNYNADKKQIMSNIATGIAQVDRNTAGNYVMYSGNNSGFTFRNTSFTTKGEVQAATTDNYIYYALSTPTDTKITDSTLISQLDAIHQFLTRYGYSATVSGNLPLIIDKTNL